MLHLLKEQSKGHQNTDVIVVTDGHMCSLGSNVPEVDAIVHLEQDKRCDATYSDQEALVLTVVRLTGVFF